MRILLKTKRDYAVNKIGKMKLLDSNANKDSLVSIGFECLDRDMFNAEKCYAPLGLTGIKHARCQTGWVKCEKQKGVYDFAWLDSVSDNLAARGITPWFCVGYGNPLYMDNIPNAAAVGCVPTLYGKETLQAWKNYVRALAEHFKSRVTHFEIWNEPDNAQFWHPAKPNARQYAELVSVTGKILREVIPDCRIGGCVSGFYFDYIEQFAQSISAGDIDFFTYHAYAKSPENNYLENVKYIRRIFNEYGLGNVELWQGENGFPSWFPENHWLRPSGRGSERQQAVWQLRRYFLDASAGIKLSSFFQIADMWEKPYQMASEVRKKPAAHGILNGLTYTPKKSFETLSRLANFFNGQLKPSDGYFRAGYPDENEHGFLKMHFVFEKASRPVYAYYIPEDVEKEMGVKYGLWADISVIGFEKGLDDPVLIDMYSGDVYSIKPVHRCESTLKFENLPYSDYPMVICDRSAFAIEPDKQY